MAPPRSRYFLTSLLFKYLMMPCYLCFFLFIISQVPDAPEHPGMFLFLSLFGLLGLYWASFVMVGLKIEDGRIYIVKLAGWERLEIANIKGLRPGLGGMRILINKGNLVKQYNATSFTYAGVRDLEKALNRVLEPGPIT